MRSCIAWLLLFGTIAVPGLRAMADDNYEPADPFTWSPSSERRVSANVSDDQPAELAEAEDSGFALPKLSLPKLPKPTLPKFEMPKLALPQWNRREPARPSGPSTWEKLSTGTKSMFTKTRDTLLPWTVDDEKPVLRSATGSRSSTGISRTRSGSNRRVSATSDEKKSFFSSLLPDSEADEKPIETTGDFLSQKRPLFD